MSPGVKPLKVLQSSVHHMQESAEGQVCEPHEKFSHELQRCEFNCTCKAYVHIFLLPFYFWKTCVVVLI